jgi:membrane protein YdbS with pleckstrin-like domain
MQPGAEAARARPASSAGGLTGKGDAMRCPDCGADADERSIFCHHCGHRLDPEEQQFESPGIPPEGAEERAAPDGEPAAPGDRLRRAAARRPADDEAEQDLWQGGYSPKAMVGDWIVCAAVTTVLVAAWAVWVRNGWLWLGMLAAVAALWLYHAALLAYRRLSVRYRLTSHRFLHESGLLRRVSDRIEIIDVDDITFEQGPIERLVGVGTIRIVSSDRTHPDLLLRGIDDVRRVADVLDDARRAERRRRALHIESI